MHCALLVVWFLLSVVWVWDSPALRWLWFVRSHRGLDIHWWVQHNYFTILLLMELSVSLFYCWWLGTVHFTLWVVSRLGILRKCCYAHSCACFLVAICTCLGTYLGVTLLPWWMCVRLVTQLCPTHATPWTVTRQGCPWGSPGKNTGVGFHFFLQGIFPTQGLNPGLLHCSQTLYQLSYRGIPAIVYD